MYVCGKTHRFKREDTPIITGRRTDYIGKTHRFKSPSAMAVRYTGRHAHYSLPSAKGRVVEIRSSSQPIGWAPPYFLPQHCLYFSPEPQGHGSLGKTFFSARFLGPFLADSSLFVPVTFATSSRSTFFSMRIR